MSEMSSCSSMCFQPKLLICSISFMLQNDMSPGDSMFSPVLLMDSDCSCDLESFIHITDPDQDELASVITNCTWLLMPN